MNRDNKAAPAPPTPRRAGCRMEAASPRVTQHGDSADSGVSRRSDEVTSSRVCSARRRES